MNWPIALVVGVVLVAVLVGKRLAFVSAAVARKHLAAGALVIDVRSPGEFQGDHVPDAVNLPLDEFSESLPRRVPDKHQVLLLHCLSGGRSGLAQVQAKRLGYPNVFNLGSLARARQLVNEARKG